MLRRKDLEMQESLVKFNTFLEVRTQFVRSDEFDQLLTFV